MRLRLAILVLAIVVLGSGCLGGSPATPPVRGSSPGIPRITVSPSAAALRPWTRSRLMEVYLAARAPSGEFRIGRTLLNAQRWAHPNLPVAFFDSPVHLPSWGVYVVTAEPGLLDLMTDQAGQTWVLQAVPGEIRFVRAVHGAGSVA